MQHPPKNSYFKGWAELRTRLKKALVTQNEVGGLAIGQLFRKAWRRGHGKNATFPKIVEGNFQNESIWPKKVSLHSGFPLADAAPHQEQCMVFFPPASMPCNVCLQSLVVAHLFCVVEGGSGLQWWLHLPCRPQLHGTPSAVESFRWI